MFIPKINITTIWWGTWSYNVLTWLKKDPRFNLSAIISMSDKGEIYSENLKYELAGSLNAFSHGISNKALSNKFKVNIKNGRWFIYVELS